MKKRILYFVQFASIGLLAACTATQPKLSDVRMELQSLDERMAYYQSSQQQALQRKQAALNQLRAIVEQEKPQIAENQTLFERRIQSIPVKPGDIEAIPLDQASDQNQELATIASIPSQPYSDAVRLFQIAHANYNRKEYSAAAEGFLLAYQYATDDDLKARCLYWAGECHYRSREWDKAIQCLTQLETQFPSHPIVAGAMLKKGLSYLNNNQKEKGIITLKSLIEQRPLSEEAPLAKERLLEIEAI